MRPMLLQPWADAQKRHPFGSGYPWSLSGISSSRASQAVASLSLGARQSPRGERDPPDPTLGALAMQLRLYWLVLEEAFDEHPEPFLDLADGVSARFDSGMLGHAPIARSRHEDHARKAILAGLKPKRRI